MNKGNKRITSRRKRKKKKSVKIESNTWHRFSREEGGILEGLVSASPHYRRLESDHQVTSKVFNHDGRSDAISAA